MNYEKAEITVIPSIVPVYFMSERRGGGACLPSFFYQKVKTDLLKIKYYQATVSKVFKKRPADEVYVCL